LKVLKSRILLLMLSIVPLVKKDLK